MKHFFVALNTGYFQSGTPSEQCIEFYTKRSSKKLYCAIVGNVVIGNGIGVNSHCGKLSSNNRWNDLAIAINTNSTIAGIQLATAWEGYIGQKLFLNNKWDDEKVRLEINNYSLDTLFNDFAEATINAQKHGFKHIQLHVAHGYLLSSLLDPIISDSSDKTLEKIFEWNNYAKSLSTETSVRISWFCGFDSYREIIRQEVLKKLFCAGIDFIDISDGYYNKDKNIIYPIKDEMIRARHLRNTNLASQFPSQNIIISGGIKNFTGWPTNVNLGFCRELIANPNLFELLEFQCSKCGGCHYYSNNKPYLNCSNWTT